MGGVDVVLFDFGNTLASERWLWNRACPLDGWVDAYARIRSDELMERWNTGGATTEDVASQAAAVLGCGVDDVVAAMGDLSRRLEFFESIMSIVAARRRRRERQALVTVNPDLFDVVETHYQLDALFDTIVVSCRYGTANKMELCDIALELLGAHVSDRVMLIDNVDEHVRAFAARGGRSYLFTNDETFAADVRRGALPFLPGDLN